MLDYVPLERYLSLPISSSPIVTQGLSPADAAETRTLPHAPRPRRQHPRLPRHLDVICIRTWTHRGGVEITVHCGAFIAFLVALYGNSYEDGKLVDLLITSFDCTTGAVSFHVPLLSGEFFTFALQVGTYLT